MAYKMSHFCEHTGEHFACGFPMNEAMHAMPHVGLDAAEVTPLLACRLADLHAFEFPRFADAPEDEVGHPLGLRSQARRRVQLATGASAARPAIHTALALQTRTDGYGCAAWRLPAARMAMAKLDGNRLRQLLAFDPESNAFRWRCRPTNRVRPGQIAGTNGRIRIDGVDYLIRDLVVLWQTGRMPKRRSRRRRVESPSHAAAG
jgi:hypothetical protein